MAEDQKISLEKTVKERTSELEEKRVRKDIMRRNNLENDKLAEDMAKQKQLDLELSYEQDKLACLPIVNESKENALNSQGRVIMKDNFKGYTEAQVRKILSDNANLKAVIQFEREQEERMKSVWRLQQEAATKAMEDMESMLEDCALPIQEEIVTVFHETF